MLLSDFQKFILTFIPADVGLDSIQHMMYCVNIRSLGRHFVFGVQNSLQPPQVPHQRLLYCTVPLHVAKQQLHSVTMVTVPIVTVAMVFVVVVVVEV